MSQRLVTIYDFPRRYEATQVDRIDSRGGKQSYGFPDAVELHAQPELTAHPILDVEPWDGEPWLGVFHGGGYNSKNSLPSRLIGWPDERSICVAYRGGAVVVRTDDPRSTYEIDSYPVRGVHVVPEYGLVLFAGFIEVVAYGRDGLAWRSGRIASDDVMIEGHDGDGLRVAGYVWGAFEHFTLDLSTGAKRSS